MKIIEHVCKASQKFTCLAYDPEYDLTIRGTEDHRLKIFAEKGSSVVYDLDVAPTIFTCILIIKVRNQKLKALHQEKGD